ncbi:uncharacterized protein LOC113234804 isoform X2 [Hyposmocoma kahamanoa]|nr:uncharacterized protein LOC113234804 isoform X2 [Hyposmocoma kahamanoa]
METFSFPSVNASPAPAQLAKFNGRQFYDTYKNAEFLHNKENLDNILGNSFKLKNQFQQLKPGATMAVEQFMINDEPLVLKKAGNKAIVGELEFTFYRLCGLVAAYVFENRYRFPVIYSSEANMLGLTWEKNNEKLCRLYLSSVSGSQDFYDQFLYYPMICALRKLHLKKTSAQSVTIIGNTKNDDGKTLVELFMDNNDEVVRLWSEFPKASSEELTTIDMERFSFNSGDNDSASAKPYTFRGKDFYRTYKDSEFLLNKQNLDNILANSFNLKNKLKQMEPGATLKLNGFKIRGEPLIVKNAEKNAVVGELEFTYYRLCGLVAAYVFDERHRFPTINSSEANVLGLTWNNKDEEKCRMYLSAVSGSQDHYDQFSFWPLICSLRKLHLKKTKLKSVLIFAKIKNDEGKTMAELFKHNYEKAECLWTLFPNATLKELIELKKLLPD